MDIVSHALFGRLLGRLDADAKLGPGSRSAFVLGALAPDVDAVFMASGWDRYLLVHEAGLHTLAASPVVAFAVALAIRAVVKQARIGSLWWAAWPSVVFGHVLFDLITGSDMRLFAPFDGRRIGPHLLAMADLLAVVMLIVGTVSSRWRPRAAALWTIAALLLLIPLKAYTQIQAVAAFQRLEHQNATSPALVSVEAINGSVFEWYIYQRVGSTARAWRVDARSGERTLRFERPVEVEAEALSKKVEVPVASTFLRLGRVPFPRIEVAGSRRVLLWSDLRDCDLTFCAISFGAELDGESHPTIQIVRIGPFEQRRPMPVVERSR